MMAYKSIDTQHTTTLRLGAVVGCPVGKEKMALSKRYNVWMNTRMTAMLLRKLKHQFLRAHVTIIFFKAEKQWNVIGWNSTLLVRNRRRPFFIVATALHCVDQQLQQQRRSTRVGVKTIWLLVCTVFFFFFFWDLQIFVSWKCLSRHFGITWQI